MTAAELLVLMSLMQCHTLTVDVPERRETIVQTICVKTEVSPSVVKEKPVAKKSTKCKRKYYWKKKRKYWRCVR